MGTPFRTHCIDWINLDLFIIETSRGSLHLENVKFFEIRAQYKTLITIINSTNLVMINTHFEKVQAYESWAVVLIETRDDFECP